MLSLTKILLPIDFSDRCVGAIRRDLPILSNHFNTEITLLHVIPTSSMGVAEMAIALSADAIAKIKQDTAARLDNFAREELDNKRVRRVLLEGDPARTIVEFAHSQKSDLIMIPTHGYGPFRRLLLGSVTSKVLHDANCPVWTSAHLENHPSPEEPILLKHILCAVDLGEHSEATLSWANQLSAEYGSKLSLVHVVAALDPRTEAYYFAPEWRNFVIHETIKDMAKLKQTLSVQAEVRIELGDIAKSVSLVAEQSKADLLVIGRGAVMGALGRFRTHASAIIRQSPCPVVSV